jgi:integrase
MAKSRGSIFKRCHCRDPHTQRPLGNDCPKLRRSNRAWSLTHGAWAYQLELPPTAEGRRRQLRRYGIEEYQIAEREVAHARRLLEVAGRDRRRRVQVADAMQAAVRAGGILPEVDTVARRLAADTPISGMPTLAEYLPMWLKRIRVEPSTWLLYETHIRVHLVPHLGDIELDKLRPYHIEELIEAIEARNADLLARRASPDPVVRRQVAGRRPTGPATIARIRASLRKAFNDALAKGIVAGVANPATLVRTPAPRHKPLVWEPERVARWRDTGTVPARVMVWTDDLLIEFLDYAAAHAPDLYPLLHFMAYRGVRRGEACGLLDAEVRLAKAEVSIVSQNAVEGGKVRRKKPKSEAGNRDIVLDPDTVAVLSAYKARRNQWQLAAGPAWPAAEEFFVRRNGRPWHPNSVSQAFRRLAERAGLPPIRLHDLRHGAATMALAAGVDIKVVSEQLGHSTTTLTRDTYQSVTKELHHDAAGAVAQVIRDRRRKRAQDASTTSADPPGAIAG